MKSWLLVGASQSLYLAFIIVRRGKRHPSQSILCLYFTIFSIIYGIVYASGNWEARELLFFLWNTNMLIGPFLLIYTLSLTASKEKTPAYIVYFIPYALSVLYSLYLLGVYDNEALEGIFSHRDYLQKPFLYLLFYLLEHISIPVFTFFSFLSLRRHKQYIEESFSYTEDINLNWLRNFIVIGFSLWLSYNIAYFFFPFLFDWSGETAQDISFIATIPFIFILAYQADKQQAIFHIQPPGISNKRKK